MHCGAAILIHYYYIPNTHDDYQFHLSWHRASCIVYLRSKSEILSPGEVVPAEFDRSGCGYRNGKVRW